LQLYTENFYTDNFEGTLRSAREIVPLVLELVHPSNVIDLGCGLGTWLSVFKDNGVKDIWGVDGLWVPSSMLQIPKERFIPYDLGKPFQKEERFDLVISLEVAEHLSHECSGVFIDSLTRLGPVILFSAAIPFQGGTNHINEQWPDYWAKQFHDRDFMVVDCIRKKIWQNENVFYWYAQNILMFVKRDYLEEHPKLRKEFEKTNLSQLSLVHPKMYLRPRCRQNL
jgi:SAM-dependent methyltransferase